MASNKKIAKRLSILWIVTYAIASIVINAYTIYVTVVTDTSPIYLLSPLQLTTLLIVLLYFYPLLYLIRHHAKLADMRKTKMVSTVAIGIFTLWLVLNLCTTLSALISQASGTTAQLL